MPIAFICECGRPYYLFVPVDFESAYRKLAGGGDFWHDRNAQESLCRQRQSPLESHHGQSS